MQVTKCVYFIALLQLCALALAASLRPPISFTTLLSSEKFNLTNEKLLLLLTGLQSYRPPDPYWLRLASSSQVLKFYGYGARITAKHDVDNSLQRAEEDAQRHAAEQVMEGREQQYGSGDVRLLLHPGPIMTWGMWEEATVGIAQFVNYLQFLDMDFDVMLAAGFRTVGTGILTAL